MWQDAPQLRKLATRSSQRHRLDSAFWQCREVWGTAWLQLFVGSCASWLRLVFVIRLVDGLGGSVRRKREKASLVTKCPRTCVKLVSPQCLDCALTAYPAHQTREQRFRRACFDLYDVLANSRGKVDERGVARRSSKPCALLTPDCFSISRSAASVDQVSGPTGYSLQLQGWVPGRPA